MNSRAKNRLLVALIVALITVLVVWYALTRQVYHQNGTLTRIDYRPTTDTAPYLTFTFSSPLTPSQVAGTTAVLKSFTVGASSPTSAEDATPFLNLLTIGPNSQGPAPFVPTYAENAPTLLSTNTLPGGATTFTQPMTITGNGMMWFAVPKKRA